MRKPSASRFSTSEPVVAPGPVPAPAVPSRCVRVSDGAVMSPATSGPLPTPGALAARRGPRALLWVLVVPCGTNQGEPNVL